jgi:hypothetical protein
MSRGLGLRGLLYIGDHGMPPNNLANVNFLQPPQYPASIGHAKDSINGLEELYVGDQSLDNGLALAM